MGKLLDKKLAKGGCDFCFFTTAIYGEARQINYSKLS